jgi:hypothetical protein
MIHIAAILFPPFASGIEQIEMQRRDPNISDSAREKRIRGIVGIVSKAGRDQKLCYRQLSAACEKYPSHISDDKRSCHVRFEN